LVAGHSHSKCHWNGPTWVAEVDTRDRPLRRNERVLHTCVSRLYIRAYSSRTGRSPWPVRARLDSVGGKSHIEAASLRAKWERERARIVLCKDQVHFLHFFSSKDPGVTGLYAGGSDPRLFSRSYLEKMARCGSRAITAILTGSSTPHSAETFDVVTI